jgi:ferritin-like metal-binding protein YciE
VFPEGGRLPGDRRHHRGSRNDRASVLQKTLDEERATDKKLTTLAESSINLRAAS